MEAETDQKKGGRSNELKQDQKGLAIDLRTLRDNPDISLHAILGSSNPKTIRVVAKIGAVKVVVLIDMGSTHNFLDSEVLQKIKLRVDKATKVHVKVANGELVGGEGNVD